MLMSNGRNYASTGAKWWLSNFPSFFLIQIELFLGVKSGPGNYEERVMQFRNAASGQRPWLERVGLREGLYGQTWNLAFLQLCLIAMGHAHEELIIKIKYSGERLSPAPLPPSRPFTALFYSATPGTWRVSRVYSEGGVACGDGGSRALVFSPAGCNIHN